MVLKIENHDTLEELQKEIKNTPHGRYRTRLQTVFLAKKGVSAKDIQKSLMISSKAYYAWIHKYNYGGKEALVRIKSGRLEGNPKWDRGIFNELFKILDKMEEYWSIPKMQKWINEEYDKDIPYSTIEYHLHKNNYSWKSNRLFTI